MSSKEPLNGDSDDSSRSDDSQPRTRLRKGKKPATNAKHAAVTRRQAAVQANKAKDLFLDNFNPEFSQRERRKLDKKLESRKLIGLINDYNGVHIKTNKDMCDCFDLQCPGCFYACKKCGSTKCGVECRCARKNKYDSIEYHGYNYVKHNPLEN